MADRASRTSSSLNGLMMAVTSFIGASEGFADREHQGAAARVLQLVEPANGVDVAVAEAVDLVHCGRRAIALGVGVDVGGGEHPAIDVLGDPDLPVAVA